MRCSPKTLITFDNLINVGLVGGSGGHSDCETHCK